MISRFEYGHSKKTMAGSSDHAGVIMGHLLWSELRTAATGRACLARHRKSTGTKLHTQRRHA